MTLPSIADYGTWVSPITAEWIAGSSLRLSAPRTLGKGALWLEGRPTEGGRNVLVHQGADGVCRDLTPAGFSVRSRAHEYGGGAYTVGDGEVFFCNDGDQRVYRQPVAGGAPRAVTPEGPWRYGDLLFDGTRKRLIAVREEHRADTDPENALVAIELDLPDEVALLAWGHDFFASPTLGRDGKSLAWLTWDHPNMPWDGTDLWRAEMTEDGGASSPVRVAGGPTESIFQPRWSPDGRLYFVSDRSGWWNLHRLESDGIRNLCPVEAEFGLPQWVFGMSTYAFTPSGDLYCAYTRRGVWHLGRLDTESGRLDAVRTPFTDVSDVEAGEAGVLCLAASPTAPTGVVLLNPPRCETRLLKASMELDLPPGYLSHPESVEFPTVNGLTAHALYYPPANGDHRPPPGERPPLLVKSHGGPTAAASTGLDLGIQFWTSRGFAVLDVNYGGSTGYGRAYRERLNGNWGVVDVNDCVNGARYLVSRNDADPERLAIRGSSAGGYTTLAALVFRDAFRAGASYYGIGDLESLIRDTHKFESRYLDRLIGPYPDRRDLYRARSPIHFTERLSAPAIFFQGLEDRVVPPDQAERMVEALRRKGLAVAYLPFPGEQHGFRQAATIRRALEAELYFYGRIFGFEPAGALEPVEIENLSGQLSP